MQIGIYGCMSYLHCGTCRQYGHLNTTDLERVRGSTKSASAIPIHLRFRTRVQYNGRVCSIGIGSLKWEGLFHRQRFTKMGGLVPQVKVQYNGRVSSIGRGSVLWEGQFHRQRFSTMGGLSLMQRFSTMGGLSHRQRFTTIGGSLEGHAQFFLSSFEAFF